MHCRIRSAAAVTAATVLVAPKGTLSCVLVFRAAFAARVQDRVSGDKPSTELKDPMGALPPPCAAPGIRQPKSTCCNMHQSTLEYTDDH
eukprot:3886718-Amphidinium_carterae.1